MFIDRTDRAHAQEAQILVTESAAISAGLPVERLEGRQLSLKGYPMTARVLTAG